MYFVGPIDPNFLLTSAQKWHKITKMANSKKYWRNHFFKIYFMEIACLIDMFLLWQNELSIFSINFLSNFQVLWESDHKTRNYWFLKILLRKNADFIKKFGSLGPTNYIHLVGLSNIFPKWYYTSYLKL